MTFRSFDFPDVFLHYGCLCSDFFTHSDLLSYQPKLPVQVRQLGIEFCLLPGQFLTGFSAVIQQLHCFHVPLCFLFHTTVALIVKPFGWNQRILICQCLK